MPKFAANFSFLYQEMPFLDRYAAAAKDGFKGVEFLFPYEFDKKELAASLAGNGLQQVLFNAPPGDWANGERGTTCLPGREAEFKQSIATALEYADALSCPRVHVVAGLIPNGETRESLRATYVSNVRYAAREAAKQDVDILIEPLNLRDNPGFFLNRQDHAHDLLADVGEPNVKVQFDLYHCQIVEGDLAMKIKKYLPTGNVGHIQMAGIPTRNEPDVGEINYDYIFGVIDEVSKDCGWNGWVGCEYRPARGAVANGTSDGLGWMKR
jgi:2-dehydrotetronate isomerase